MPVRPGGRVLHTTQQRLREKQFLAGAGLPVTPFAAVHSLAELEAGLTQLGHAGHPQDRCLWLRRQRPGAHRRTDKTPRPLGTRSDNRRRCSKHLSTLTRELSVVAARGLGRQLCPLGRDREYRIAITSSIFRSHRRRLPPRTWPTTRSSLARAVLEKLDVVGVLCVEMFVDQRGGLLINELAPRPHNSGHLTIDAVRHQPV